MEKSKAKKQETFEGKFFHAIDENGKVGWQGMVLTKVDQYYLILLFEWFTGEPTIQKLIKLEDMVNWNFYDTAEQLRYYYDKRLSKGLK